MLWLGRCQNHYTGGGNWARTRAKFRRGYNYSKPEQELNPEEDTTTPTTVETITTNETAKELKQGHEITENINTTPITELTIFLSCNSNNTKELPHTDDIERIDHKYDHKISTNKGDDLLSSANVL